MSTTWLQSASYHLRVWIMLRRGEGHEPTADELWTRIRRPKDRTEKQCEALFQDVARLDARARRKAARSV